MCSCLICLLSTSDTLSRCVHVQGGVAQRLIVRANLVLAPLAHTVARVGATLAARAERDQDWVWLAW